jgi:3-hydroxymyristoyl/3-hydroxydecanoyl-(acyl carrier protein) dehydratase
MVANPQFAGNSRDYLEWRWLLNGALLSMARQVILTFRDGRLSKPPCRAYLATLRKSGLMDNFMGSMRFCQLNRITLLEPGVRIEATRTLRASEDYLRDHFPRFAVMPGVLMLEALFQASALLVRATEGYKSGLVLLQEAKNVKFADFVQPGKL